MSLPVGISTCTVTFGGAVTFRGQEAESVTGTLSADRDVVWSATGLGIYSADEDLPDQAGSLSFLVPHVDQAGFSDGSGNATTNWFYILNARVRFASGKTILVRKRFQVFVGETTKDLDLVGDGPIIPGVTIPNTGITRADVATDIADPDSAIGEALSAEFVSTAGTLLSTNEALDAAKEPGFYTVALTVTNVPFPGAPQTLAVASGPVDPGSSTTPVTQTLTLCADATDGLSAFVRAWDVLNDGPWCAWTRVATQYESGKRDITGTDILGGNNGILWRIGDRCYLDLNPNQDSIDPTLWNALPNGFRSISDGGYQSAGLAFDDSGKPIATVMVEHNGFIFLPELPTVSTPIAYAVGLVSWLTADAPPATLPGVPFF